MTALRRGRRDEEQERHLDERERVVGEHADGERGDDAAIAPQQPASVGVVLLRLPAERAGRAAEEPEPARTKPSTPVSSSVPSHWLSRILALSARARVGDARAEALAEERLLLPLLQRRAEVGEPAAAALAGVRLLLGDECRRREERAFQRAQRPGQDERGRRSGPGSAPARICRVSGGRSQRKTDDDDEQHHDARCARRSDARRATRRPAQTTSAAGRSASRR